ncbi:MAG: N-acyl homoserine lactonase family protein [Deltaproteobacteria bacterium]|nr:N-acyl homoserine lactonase family protein [Deltaproteobacteria bacterium]
MKLYFFEAGVLKSYKQYFTMGLGVGEPFDVPVPFLLIEHPKGIVLFDTGNALEVVKNKKAHWGDILAAYDPVMSEEQWCVNAIQKVGYKPKDVKYVILSHLHLDHAGCVGHFPNARYIVQRDELHYAYTPDYFMKLAYIRKDFDKPVDWLILNGWRDDKFDLFNDGKLIIYLTPGHTPGHQSILVNLPKTGPMFFAADSCYTLENLNNNVLSGLAWNFGESVKSVERMKALQSLHGAQIVTGHDPEGWKAYKQAPKFYE